MAPIETHLLEAVRAGATEKIQVLLRAGADVAYRDTYGFTPLYLAVLKGDFAVIELLLQHGAPVDQEAIWGCTPLTIAAQKGRTRILQLLLEHCKDTNRVNSLSGPLHMAAVKGYRDIVGLLLASGAHANATFEGSVPVLMATSDPAIMLMLMDAGADPNCGDEDGRTPLMRAASALFEELEDHPRFNPNACLVHFRQVVRALIAAGADVTARDRSGRTAVSYAASDEIQELVVIEVHKRAAAALSVMPDWLPVEVLRAILTEARLFPAKKGAEVGVGLEMAALQV